MKRSVTIIIIVILLGAFQAKGQELVFPGDTWDTTTPGSLKMDAALLDSIAGLLHGRGCIVKDGSIIKSWGDQEKRSDWMSAVKPVFSTFLFFAVEEGKIPGVHCRIKQVGWELSQKDSSMEFYHLANMCSGYALSEKPGEAWAYNDFAIQLYQKSIFEKVFQQNPDTVLANRLGILRFQDRPYFRDDKPRLYASARDFARIGWFWMNHGEWEGRFLLPANYFEKYMQPHTPHDLPTAVKCDTDDYLHIGTFGGGANHFTKYGPGIYGFNWWFNGVGRLHPENKTWPDATDETFMAIGAGGNVMAMVPELNLILSNAQGHWGKLEPGNSTSNFNLVMKLLIESCRSEL